MAFELDEAIALLARTPDTLRELLGDLPDAWTRTDEGEGTFSAFDVVGHLIHGERTDWLPRARIILEHGEKRAFEPFDRFAQLRENEGRPLGELLDTFDELRQRNLIDLKELDLSARDLERAGTHPELGRVTLGQLLATWVVHDLDHLCQIARVMASRYRKDTGPWWVYHRILEEPRRGSAKD
jgi:hypothetical protein